MGKKWEGAKWLGRHDLRCFPLLPYYYRTHYSHSHHAVMHHHQTTCSQVCSAQWDSFHFSAQASQLKNPQYFLRYIAHLLRISLTRQFRAMRPPLLFYPPFLLGVDELEASVTRPTGRKKERERRGRNGSGCHQPSSEFSDSKEKGRKRRDGEEGRGGVLRRSKSAFWHFSSLSFSVQLPPLLLWRD